MRERVKDWRDWIGLQFASNTDAANTAKNRRAAQAFAVELLLLKLATIFSTLAKVPVKKPKMPRRKMKTFFEKSHTHLR